MKTFQTLDGKFVSEDPGLKNTIFGYDKNGTPVILGSILYHDYCPSECYFTLVDEYNWNYINYDIRQDYVVISSREAAIIAKKSNRKIYGQWKN